MFLKLALLFLLLFSMNVSASSDGSAKTCTDMFMDDSTRYKSLAPNQDQIFKLQKGILTPSHLQDIHGVMVFDRNFRKVITVSTHLEDGRIHRLTNVSPFYNDIAKLIIDINDNGEVLRVWPILPNGRYEMVYLQVHQSREQLFNDDAYREQSIAFIGVGTTLRFKIKNGTIY